MPFETLLWLTVLAFSSEGFGVGLALADLDLLVVYVFAGFHAGVFGDCVFGAGAPTSPLCAGGSKTGLVSSFILLLGSLGKSASASRLNLFFPGVWARFSGSSEASAVFNASVSFVVVVLERRDLADWEAIVGTFAHSSTSIDFVCSWYSVESKAVSIGAEKSRSVVTEVIGVVDCRDEMSRGSECDNEQFSAGDERRGNAQSIAENAELRK